MNTQEIKRGEYNAYYPISEVKLAEVNRDTVEKHVKDFSEKILNYGWMTPPTISSTGDVIEGHHRIQAAMLIGQKTIPAYIIDWIDTSNRIKLLEAIINLNNGNRAWFKIDYLKAFSESNKDYNTVYKAHLKNSNNISIGNIINCYFRKKSTFNKGKSKIQNRKFAEYLILNFSRLVSLYSTKKIQAYCVRELINVAYNKAQMDVNKMDYIFKYYEGMAITKHEHLTSISEFKVHIENVFNEKYSTTK